MDLLNSLDELFFETSGKQITFSKRNCTFPFWVLFFKANSRSCMPLLLCLKMRFTPVIRD